MADQDGLMTADFNGDAAANDDKHVNAPSENEYYEIDDNRIRIVCPDNVCQQWDG